MNVHAAAPRYRCALPSSRFLGAIIVPHRVLALHPNQRLVQRITTNPRFSRELIVVVRRQQQLPDALAGFVENILF
jgi:hypothetical protein